MIKILVIGQTPPPYGGQAMMISRLINAQFGQVKIFHVRMAFSEDFKQVGQSSLKKLWHLPNIIIKAISLKFKHGIHILYYPPAGPNLNPVLRDLLILIPLRIFFRKTVFHFRAAGVSDFISSSNFLIRMLARLAYAKPSVSIQLSSLNPPDGLFFKSSRVEIIPNGLEDNCHEIPKRENDPLQLLYVGVIREDKGILILLEAVNQVKRSDRKFRLILMGDFASSRFESIIKDFIREKHLNELVEFVGIKKDEEKWSIFRSTDILCFPTFFDSESFGNVVVEGMMFGIPVIATNWRGIPDIIDHNRNGLLVPIQNSKALAKQIVNLLDNKFERERLGISARKAFLEKYQLSTHLNRMENCFVENFGNDK